jgi:hypothetical protein
MLWESYEFPGSCAEHRGSHSGRVIEADENEITPDVARYLLSMQLPETDRDRVDELSAKARSGSLTRAEEAELDSYLHIGSLLGVMQSRARRFLKKTGGAAPQ